jgi:hypothetical protein
MLLVLSLQTLVIKMLNADLNYLNINKHSGKHNIQMTLPLFNTEKKRQSIFSYNQRAKRKTYQLFFS